MSHLTCDVGLEDILNFGKHKNRNVEEVYKEDSGYLVWWREKCRAEKGNSSYFNVEMNTLLDMTIEESKSLRGKYKTWKALGLYENPTTGGLEVTVKSEAKPAPWAEPEVEYAVWGAF